MRVAVFAHPDSWYARDLQRAAKGRHEVEIVDFARLHTYLGATPSKSGKIRHSTTIAANGTPLADFEIFLIRTMPPGSLEQVVYRMDVLGQLAQSRVTIINPPRVIEVAVDKYLTSQRLANAGLPTPETWVGHDAEAAMCAFEQLGQDVVVKPLFGGEGRGIARITDKDLAHRGFRWLERHGEVIYLQTFVNHPGFDIRVFWIGETAYAMKRSNLSDWRTNVARGATTSSHVLTDEQRELAWRAHQAVGAEISGVDLLPTTAGQLFVLEVNAVPGWKRLARTIDLDIGAKVLSYAVAKHHARTNASASSDSTLTPRKLTT